MWYVIGLIWVVLVYCAETQAAALAGLVAGTGHGGKIKGQEKAATLAGNHDAHLGHFLLGRR